MTRSILISLALLSSGCGLTSPGGGTGTLFVTARLTSDGSTGGSRARITIRAGATTGDLVKNAEVAIRGGALGRTIVPYDDGKDQYRLDGFSWVEGFRLEVIRGSDQLDGSIEAPGATLITDPIANSTYRRADGAPLVIRWKDDRGTARPARPRSTWRRRTSTAPSPRGSSSCGSSPTSCGCDKEKVRVERSNEVALAGGAPGSVLSAGTDHEIEFTVE